MGGRTDYVEMGIPKVNNVKKFAYARVIRTSTFLEYVESEKVKNVYGDELFRDLPRVDFINVMWKALNCPCFSRSWKSSANTGRSYYVNWATRRKENDCWTLFAVFITVCITWKTRNLNRSTPKAVIRPVSHNHYFIPENRIACA